MSFAALVQSASGHGSQLVCAQKQEQAIQELFSVWLPLIQVAMRWIASVDTRKQVTKGYAKR